jgi:hypothetical protein
MKENLNSDSQQFHQYQQHDVRSEIANKYVLLSHAIKEK